MQNKLISEFELSVLTTFRHTQSKPGANLSRLCYDSWFLDRYQALYSGIYFDCFIEALLNLRDAGLIILGEPGTLLKGSDYNIMLTEKGFHASYNIPSML